MTSFKHNYRSTMTSTNRLLISFLRIFCFIPLLTVAQAQLVRSEPPAFAVKSFPPRLEVNEGEPLSLKCDVSRAEEVRWLRDGVENGVRTSVYQLNTVSRRDAGSYRCIATNSVGSILSPSVSVVVNYMDDFNHDAYSENEYTVTIGPEKAFVLKRPPLLSNDGLQANYVWYKESAEITSNSSFYVSLRGDLVGIEAGPSAAGKYKVVASADGLSDAMSKEFTVIFADLAPSNTFSVIYGLEDEIIVSSGAEWKSFDCVTTIKDGVTTQWLMNDTQLSPDMTGVSISQGGRRLSLQNPSAFKRGSQRLSCEAEAQQQQLVATSSAEITFRTAPSLRELPSQVANKLHASLQLQCVAKKKASTPTSLRWYFNGKPIRRNSGLLSLPRINAADYGIYQCEASNEAGSDIATVWLHDDATPVEGGVADEETTDGEEEADTGEDDTTNAESEPQKPMTKEVPEPPVPLEPRQPLPIQKLKQSFRSLDDQLGASSQLLTDPPQDASVTAGAEHLIPCSSSVEPDAVPSWKFNGNSLDTSNVKYAQMRNGLLIRNVDKADSGLYTCTLQTSHGRAEASATLTVAGENLIEYGPTDQKILIGTNWEFPCRVNKLYRNATSTTWYFNDEQIEPSPRISVNSDGSLRIALLQPLDSGEYKCVVEEGDRREEMVGILRVLERPSQPMSIRADLITGVPAKVKVVWKPGFDGNSAILRYMIEMRTNGAMDLWTDWERVADSIPVEDCCTYLIDNLKPSTTAEFRVLASNRYGDSVPSKASSNVTMPQQPPASAPRNVHASARSANAVMVQWQPPQEEYWSGDILGYVVRYRLAGYSHAWTEKNMTSKDARNAMLDQLITWHEYEVQVAAYNQRGLGVFSKNALVTTNEGLPTQAPRKLRVNVINSTAVRVTFTPPSQQSIPGVNLGYKVQFWQDGGDKDKFSKQVVVDPEWSEVNVVVDGLDKFGRYNVTALCFTQPGEGPKSQPVEFVTEQDVPGPVAKISVEEVMYNGAVLVWDPPTEPNGIITRYVLRYWNDATPSQKERVELRGTETNYTIDGLTPSTRYSVDVSPTTIKGDGPLQETRFESGVPPVLPERPSSLSVTDIQARSVSLQFVPGKDGFTAIRRWIVEARVGDSSVFQTVFNISAPKARSFTVTGLRPFTKYQLRVIAENVKGRSAPSEPTRQFETKQTNPETLAPGLFAEPTSSSSLAISWTPLIAAHWNGQPRGYLIIYKEEEEENWKEVRISSLRASDFTLRDLRPYVTYNVDVFAENLFGRSASSGAVHAKTYEGVPTGSPLSVRATVINAKTIDVEWDALDEEVANGEVLGYQVRVAPEEHLLRKEDSKIIDVPGDHGHSIRVTNLLPFTVYQVFVLAYTIVGRGPENTVPAVVTTSEALPTVPTGVSFSNVMENNLVIKWTPPEHPNGVIKGYRVSYRRMGGDWTEAPVPNGMYNFHVSVGADGRNTDYQFSVAAENGEGVGPAATVNVHASSVRVPVRNPPAPFRDTQARYSPSEVSISWDDGMPEEIDAPVRFVQIEYEKQKGDGWQAYARNVAGTTNTTTIKGLSPNSNYRFRIRFAGDFAQSAWSAESEWMKTLPTAPQAPPTSVQSSPYDSNSLLLQWNSPPMSTWNAEAIGYHVSYRIYSTQNNNDSSWFTEEISISSDRVDREQYVLAKLSSFHHYIVRMSSFNGEGDSHYSPPVFVYVGYSIPKRNITNLRAEPLSSTSLAVRWDQWRPDESDVISGFKVRYVPLTSVLSPTKVDEELIVVENNTCVLTDLLKFTEYQISITAYNRAGEGAMSQVREKTLEDIPGPVGELRFKDVLLDSALVTWDVPTQPNGVIVAYNVSYYTMKMQENFVNTAQTTTHLNFYPAAKLVEGATYFFSVRAVTNAGKGAETTGNVTIGPSSLGPAAPTAPKLYPGQSSVTLDWNEAGNPRRTIVGHLIQAKRVSNAADSAPSNHHRRQRRASDRPQHLLSTWITLKLLEGSANSHQVSYRDLEPSSYYVFRVFSRNEHGVGAPSFESEELYVPASIPDDPFYTTWWFIALVAMATFVVIVVVVACLCITGSSAKYRREKRNSVDSLQLADGNLVAFQHQKQHRVNARSRADVGRPATTQSWISDRDPPAYGSVLGERESASGGSVVNMYGLATDVIPSTYHHNANHDAMQRLSTLVGRDVRGSAYIVPPQQRGSVDMLNRSDYSRTDSRSVRGADFSMINNSGAGMGLRSMYGALPARPVAAMPPAAMMMDDNFEDDSFDEDDSVADEVDMGMNNSQRPTSLPPPPPPLTSGGIVDDIAGHYGSTDDNCRDAWRRAKAADGVNSESLVSSTLRTPSSNGSSSGDTTTSTSHQTVPNLASGFSSFV